MQIKNLSEKAFVKQFISYFFVGGIAAIVEWTLFFVFANIICMDYILATCGAFIFSTATNWILGRIWTFKDNKAYDKKKLKELFFVFSVSAIGLLFNIGLMYIFVSLMGMTTATLKIISKIAATGIVFVWNFLVRKFVIYK